MSATKTPRAESMIWAANFIGHDVKYLVAVATAFDEGLKRGKDKYLRYRVCIVEEAAQQAHHYANGLTKIADTIVGQCKECAGDGFLGTVARMPCPHCADAIVLLGAAKFLKDNNWSIR